MTGRHPRFAWEDAIGESDLSPRARHVAHLYACHLGRDGRAWPSNETLARKSGLSVATVKRAKKELVAVGWLAVVVKGSGPGKSTVVEARIPPANRLTGDLVGVGVLAHLVVVSGSSEGVGTGSPMSHEQPKVEQTKEQPTTDEGVLCDEVRDEVPGDDMCDMVAWLLLDAVCKEIDGDGISSLPIAVQNQALELIETTLRERGGSSDEIDDAMWSEMYDLIPARIKSKPGLIIWLARTVARSSAGRGASAESEATG